MNWINDPGTNNLQDPFEGGEPASIPYAVIDCSALASELLGRQVPQSAKYRLRGVQIGFRNQDDTVLTAENHSETSFQGKLQWFHPTEHALKALRLARNLEKNREDNVIDADSLLLSTEKDYSAMRFGWSGDDDVYYQTTHGISGYGTQWDLLMVQHVYNTMTVPDENNALFAGRFPDRSTLGWSATVASGDFKATNNTNSVGGQLDFLKDGMYHDVLAGLMMCSITHSTIASTHGATEDDYQWYIGIDLEVEF